jgi:hypothetical protein
MIDMSKSLLLLAAAVSALAIAFVGSSSFTTSSEAAPPTAAGVTIPIDSPLQGGGSFVGDITVDRFFKQNGQLFVEGTATGTLTTAEGIVTDLTDAAFTAPVSAADSSCQILDLNVGPIDLDLLGLVVTTDPIHLNITAEQAPGNLLGNLLCAVTHLLDSNASSNAIANQLNSILGQLG